MNREKAKRIEKAMVEIQDALSDINQILPNINQILSSEDTDDSETYNKGLEDAWELAKKIFKYDHKQNEEIFGYLGIAYILNNLEPQEALAKLEAYEKAKEIKVGDVVRIQGTNFEYLVTHIEVDNIGKKYYCGISKGGKGLVQGNVEKTGKHIDISSILEQIGGGE